ncbi:MAG: hypothetical protein WC438_01035 [Candidatus Pacearchaeota archaeon]
MEDYICNQSCGGCGGCYSNKMQDAYSQQRVYSLGNPNEDEEKYGGITY